MSKLISVVNTSSDTFQIWINRTNETINCISTEVVTVNSHANGGLTTGNGYVEGIFGGRNMCANTIRGGTVETAGNLNLTSNLTITGAKLVLGDIVVNTTDIAINTVSITQLAGLVRFANTTIGTTDQLITFFDKLVYRGGEYILTIKDTNANQHQISKALVMHDSGNAYMSEYGVVYSNTSLGEFSANANATHIRVYLTPTTANASITGTVLFVNIQA